MTAVLVGLLVLSTSVWIGGMAAIIVVARASRRTLEESERVRLFRAIGRAYLPVAGTALMVLLACVAILFASRPWDALTTAAVVLGVALVAALTLGVRQARAMGRIRSGAVQDPGSAVLAERVRTGARLALVLRSVIVALSLALYVVVVAALAG